VFSFVYLVICHLSIVEQIPDCQKDRRMLFCLIYFQKQLPLFINKTSIYQCVLRAGASILGRRGGRMRGREILLYLMIYRKYAQKWWLLKRNRIIWPEAALNGQFFLENRNILRNCLKNRNFSEICLERSKFFTRIHDPQISNQNDAAD